MDAEDPWNPSERTKEDVKNVFDGVHKILKVGGYFISLSFEQP